MRSAALSDIQPISPACWAGIRVADRLHVKPPLSYATQRWERRSLPPRSVRSTGGPEDDQILVPLDLAQRLAALPGRISRAPDRRAGHSGCNRSYIANLQKQLPDADVHAIRQFTEAEGKIYNRISGLLTATVVLVLVLTALCVMAAMTNVAMERKNDVGLMKAIGGATRRVLRLFLAEAALLGLIGGVIGAAAGILLSIWLGKAVFGVAARPA